jgi:adenylate cyclase class IV
VRKSRRSGTCQWEHREVLVAVDRVEGLGDFVELELAAQETDIESAGKVLASLAGHLSLGPSERRSYLELLMEKQKQ